jgi:putative tributyrin esterase
VIKVIDEVFSSSLTKRKHPFKVLLPQDYEASRTNYPVLYLLHGLFGNSANWLELTDLENYLTDHNFIAVLPEGYDKWYSDSASNAEDKFESSFIKELIPTIEKKYKVSGNRQLRAVAGLSMGGYGALKFALKRPNLFVFAGSMSGAFNAPQIAKSHGEPEWNELRPSVSEVFGEEKSRARIENDLFEIIRGISPEKISSVPYLYFDCGTEDNFLKINRELAELLTRKKIVFEYQELSGGHDWDYWDRQIRVILKKAAEIFNQTTRQKLI